MKITIDVTDKEITCAKIHLAIYEYYAQKEKVADITLPCEICKYVMDCRKATSSPSPPQAGWLFRMNDDKTASTIKEIEQYISNKAKTGIALLSDI